MGGAASKQQLGQRVIAARKKLEEEQKFQDEQSESLRNASPKTMKLILDRMQKSFETFSPFLERTLLVAWNADKDKCKEFVLAACKKVLSAPIQEHEYDWFKQYVLPSSMWMFETSKNRFMYQDLMAIVQRQSADIVNNMDSVYAHLTTHNKWSELMAIANQSVVDRQDHKSVGLLKDAGIQSIADEKDEEIRSFVDSHVGITTLTVTAKALDQEFQTYVGAVMGRYGEFKKGPMKKVDRCLSKLENDYSEAAYPASAKLLDIIRCSLTFNTLEQLLIGYQALMNNMGGASSYITLARVKNGFLDKSYDGGYRDIKVNVVFQSAIDPEIKMICEVQLILSQYLNEKKKIHKLYSIAREETYYELTVREEQDTGPQKDVKDLDFVETLDVGKEISLSNSQTCTYKCCVDPEFQLLSMESDEWCGVVDMKRKKQILNLVKKDDVGEQASQWVTIGQQKYLAVQLSNRKISMLKVVPDKDSFKFPEDTSYKIEANGTIFYCDFDRDFKNIVLVVDGNTLELRSMSDSKKVKKSIKLGKSVDRMALRCLQLSADGKQCVVSGGNNNPYFYVIDVESGQQRKFTSEFLADAYAPCFINGETKFVFVGDSAGKMEIWDIELNKAIKTIELKKSADVSAGVKASASTRNILAVGSRDKTMRLYDVRNWECFYSKQFECEALSLHLTQDLQYVTFAGDGKQRCVVLKIQ